MVLKIVIAISISTLKRDNPGKIAIIRNVIGKLIDRTGWYKSIDSDDINIYLLFKGLKEGFKF